MIEITNLSKSFYQGLPLNRILKKSPVINVLDNLSLKVKSGEIFALTGPNGAGKTTLLKILATLILPDKGTITINQYNITKEPNKIKKSIGLLTGDERNFYWRLTGYQNLEFFGIFHGIAGQKIKHRISELTDLLSIKSLKKRVGEYSTGMRQKLNLARALLHNPEVLLMDEPTKSLDPESASTIRKIIKDELVKKQGKTILMVTHNLHEAEEISDKKGTLKEGKLSEAEI